MDPNTVPDPDLAFKVNADGDSNKDYFMTKMKAIVSPLKLNIFKSQIAIESLIQNSHAQVKTIITSEKLAMLVST